MTTTTTDTAAAASIQAAARELKLPIVRTDAARVAADAERSKLSYLGFLAEILEAEVDARTERRRARRIHDAKFPRIKRLADFDLDAAPTVEPARSPPSPPAATSTPATRSSCSAIPAPARSSTHRPRPRRL